MSAGGRIVVLLRRCHGHDGRLRRPGAAQGVASARSSGRTTGVFFALMRRIDAARHTTANP